MSDTKIVLASRSPRRRQLLTCLFDEFDAVSPDVGEELPPGVPPDEAVTELACRKAKAALEMPECRGKTVIAADTLVFLGGEVFGKPGDEKEARDMLRRLSGRVHRVYTGVCVVAPDGRSVSFCEETDVEFYPLADDEIEAYVATGEPMDKAGAYGIQGKGAALVRGIRGDFYNVMGLPVGRLKRVIEMLRLDANVRCRDDRPKEKPSETNPEGADLS
ncbi:MAG: Maf family protein [Oscillospiraceae bacterium]|nr:Maf family protein [Oscillospiraceae bacterium]